MQYPRGVFCALSGVVFLQDRARDVRARLAGVHGRFFDAPVRLGLRHARGDEGPFRPLHEPDLVDAREQLAVLALETVRAAAAREREEPFEPVASQSQTSAVIRTL